MHLRGKKGEKEGAVIIFARRPTEGPFTYDVRTGRGEGVAENVTTVLIGCNDGTVTRGRGPKVPNLSGRHL